MTMNEDEFREWQERRIEERLRYYTQPREQQIWMYDKPVEYDTFKFAPIDPSEMFDPTYLRCLETNDWTDWLQILSEQKAEVEETERVSRRLLEQVFGSE
jgi:hypothetical protein